MVRIVCVLRVVSPGAPRFDSSSSSHGDSACIPTVDGCDNHGCHGAVCDRVPQPAGDTGGITDGVSCSMADGCVERDAGTAVAASTIGALAGNTDTHSCGRHDSGDDDTDENIRGCARRGVGCCGGGDGGAVIDAAPSPQHSMRRIPDAGVSLFDVPVVLERRYVTTPPNRDKKTLGFSNASASTGVDVSVDEEAGAPLLGKSRKDASISTTGGDSRGDTTGGAAPSSDGNNEYCERHQEAW